MAFDKTPSTWLGPGYTLVSHVAGFTTATAGSNIALPQLSDTEANATTGDIREIAFALMEALYTAWVAQGAAGRPVEMTIAKNVSPNPATGVLTNQYIVTIATTVLTQNVTPEPS